MLSQKLAEGDFLIFWISSWMAWKWKLEEVKGGMLLICIIEYRIILHSIQTSPSLSARWKYLPCSSSKSTAAIWPRQRTLSLSFLAPSYED
jgi:hypothetical protein